MFGLTLAVPVPFHSPVILPNGCVQLYQDPWLLFGHVVSDKANSSLALVPFYLAPQAYFICAEILQFFLLRCLLFAHFDALCRIDFACRGRVTKPTYRWHRGGPCNGRFVVGSNITTATTSIFLTTVVIKPLKILRRNRCLFGCLPEGKEVKGGVQ